MQGEVNDAFLESLAALHQKLDFLSQSSLAQACPVIPPLPTRRHAPLFVRQAMPPTASGLGCFVPAP